MVPMIATWMYSLFPIIALFRMARYFGSFLLSSITHPSRLLSAVATAFVGVLRLLSLWLSDAASWCAWGGSYSLVMLDNITPHMAVPSVVLGGIFTPSGDLWDVVPSWLAGYFVLQTFLYLTKLFLRRQFGLNGFQSFYKSIGILQINIKCLLINILIFLGELLL